MRGLVNGRTGEATKGEVIDLFARHVSSGKAAFFKSAGIDFVLGKREGPYLWDLAGEKQLIDCHCNGGVFNLGHRNPEIMKVLIQSLKRYDIGNHHLISEARASLAVRLAELSPPGMTYTVFGVSGGEAIDLAIKVARGHTRKAKIVSVQGGYHGHTGLALAAGDEKYRAPFGPLAPGFHQVPFDDLPCMDRAVDDDTAAVILEPIPATSGMPIASREYFPGVREICDRRGALLIADEVQTGLGRTGKFWGLEHFGLVPDILVIGKGLSGGIFPMTATCFREPLEAVFHQDPFIHISTFGGAEVGCPVALKVLDISSEPEFLEHVNELGGIFARGIEKLRTRHREVLRGLRQVGLMMGVEMVSGHCGPLFTRAAYDHGLLSVYAYNNPSVSQLLPPLLIDQTLAQEILHRVDDALTDVERMLQEGGGDRD